FGEVPDKGCDKDCDKGLWVVVSGGKFEWVEGHVEGIGAVGRGVGSLSANREGAVGVASESEARARGDLEDKLWGVNRAGGRGDLFLKTKEPGFVIGDGDEAIERARQWRRRLTEHGADDVAAWGDIKLGGLVGGNGLSGGEGANLVGHAARRGVG